MPHITPLLIKEDIDVLQFLKDEYAYITVDLQKGDQSQYALIEIPTDHLPRFVMLPEKKASDVKRSFYSTILFAIALMNFLKAFSNTMLLTAMR